MPPAETPTSGTDSRSEHVIASPLGPVGVPAPDNTAPEHEPMSAPTEERTS